MRRPTLRRPGPEIRDDACREHSKVHWDGSRIACLRRRRQFTGSAGLVYSIVMLAALISSALALMSATRCLAMSSGDCSGTTALTAIILAFMSSVLAISIILALSLAMMSLEVPAGA